MSDDEEDEGEDDDGDGGTVHSFEEEGLTTSSELTILQEVDRDADKDKDSLRIDYNEAMSGNNNIRFIIEMSLERLTSLEIFLT